MIEYNFKKIKPFKWFVLENFPFIEEDFDALTNWQLFCKLGKEMNKIIESQNNVGEQTEVLTNAFNEYTENLTNAFNELQEYVNNYFANLDVQEEINNKLDEMVEQGVLQEIIADYLNSKAIFGYDTVNSMKSSTNLINGSYAKTLGFHNKNDGGSALYKIRTRTLDDVIDNATLILLDNETLVAEFINEDKSFINVNKFGLTNNLYMNDYWEAIYNYALANNLYIYFPTGTYKAKKENIANDYIFAGNFISMKGNNATIYCESSIDENTDLFKFTGIPNSFNQFIKGIKFDTENNNYSEVRHFLHFVFSDLHLFYNLQIENNVFMKSSNYAIYTLGNTTTGGFNNCKFNNNIVYGLFLYSESFGDSNKINGNNLYASEEYQLGDYPIKLKQTSGSSGCQVCANNCSGGLGSFDSFFELLIQNNQIENVHQNLDYLINLIGAGNNIKISDCNLNAHNNSDLIYTRIYNTEIDSCFFYGEKSKVINSYAHLTKINNIRWWNGNAYVLMLTGDKVVGEVTDCLYTTEDRKYYIDNELNMHIKPLVTSSIALSPYQTESDNTYPYSQPIEYDNNTIKTIYHNNINYVRTDVLLNSYAVFKIQDF